MAGLPAVVRPCIEEALTRAPRLLQHAAEAASSALLEDMRGRPGGPVRDEFAAAAHDLTLLSGPWAAQLPDALREAIASGGASRATPAPSSGLNLTLVDDSEVMESIEASRLAQQLAGLLDGPLGELDAYMSSALQLEGIQPERNPLRPAIYAQAVRSVMKGPDVQPGRPALWMRYMAEPIANELRVLYQDCCKLLARANVRAAGYRLVTSAVPLGATGASGAAPLEAAPTRVSGPAPLSSAHAGRPPGDAIGWAEVLQAFGGAALREFLVDASARAQQPLAPEYYQRVDQELAELEGQWDEAPPDPMVARQYQHLAPVDRPARAIGTATALSREVWGDYSAPRQRSLVRAHLRRQAREMGQVMGLEVVRQLVDQVAQDPRLLAPVREAIVALEPSLARLALASPRFVVEEANPARQLLEAVAQRSFKFNDEFSAEFQRFHAGVTSRFRALNALDTLADPQPFREALDELSGDWSADDQQEQQRQQTVLAAVQQAERRQEEAGRIAWELSQRSDLHGVPTVVQDFLFGPWALVIAHARLSAPEGQLDPGGFVAVVTDLLWSVKREETVRDPAHAFEVIPRVLVKLRAGLDLLHHPARATADFFKALERLHRPVLKLRARHRQQSLDPEIAADVTDQDLTPAEAQTPAEAEDLWLRDSELQACGFSDTMPTDFGEPGPAETEHPGSAPHQATEPLPIVNVGGVPLTLDADQANELIAGLQEGSWVDLYSKQCWYRARLKWIGGKRTLFLFVSHGGRPHSMTLRTLERLVVSRMLRPVDTQEVVQHAIEALGQPQAEPVPA